MSGKVVGKRLEARGLVSFAQVERFAGVRRGDVRRHWVVDYPELLVTVPSNTRPVEKISLRALWRVMDPAGAVWGDYQTFLEDFRGAMAAGKAAEAAAGAAGSGGKDGADA